MIQEIISTSASRCLDGNAGFGIVAQTVGMAPNVCQAVNALSGYAHIAAPGSGKNPVIYLHATRKTAGVLRHIISRIADCGNDYSGRSNRIAHHWIVEEENIRFLQGGPAELTAQDIFRSHWQDKPTELPQKKLSAPDISPKKCTVWEQLTGDSGWGGVVAEHAEKWDPISIAFSPEHNSATLRTLIGEALALLPSSVRWKVTFSTYFMQSHEASGDKIQIKCFLAGSEESKFIRQSPSTFVIDLRQRLEAAPAGKYVELARGMIELPPKKQSETKIPADTTSVPSLSRVQRALQQVASKKIQVEETSAMDFLMKEHNEGTNFSAANMTLPKESKWQTYLRLLQPIVIIMLVGGLIGLTWRNAYLYTAEALSEKIHQKENEHNKTVEKIKSEKNGEITALTDKYRTEIDESKKKITELEKGKEKDKAELEKSSKELEKANKKSEDETIRLEKIIKDLETENAELKKTNENKINSGEITVTPETIPLNLGENLKKLPHEWTIVLPPDVKPLVLQDSKFLGDHKERVTLEHPFQVTKSKDIFVQSQKHTITFSFAGTPNPDIRRDESLAKIELTESGLRFEWVWNKQPNDRLKNILLQIAQSELRIRVAGDDNQEPKVINLRVPD